MRFESENELVAMSSQVEEMLAEAIRLAKSYSSGRRFNFLPSYEDIRQAAQDTVQRRLPSLKLKEDDPRVDLMIAALRNRVSRRLAMHLASPSQNPLPASPAPSGAALGHLPARASPRRGPRTNRRENGYAPEYEDD